VGWLIDTSLWIAVEAVNSAQPTSPPSPGRNPCICRRWTSRRFSSVSISYPREQEAKGGRRASSTPPKAATAHHGRNGRSVRSTRRQAARRDPSVRINDLWLAAQAIQRNLKLLTSNPRDFKDIPGLKMVALPRPW